MYHNSGILVLYFISFQFTILVETLRVYKVTIFFLRIVLRPQYINLSVQAFVV